MSTFYHVWFRAEVGTALEGEVAEDARQLLLDTARGTEIDVLEVEVAFDRTHMLMAVNEGQDVPEIVHQLMATSSLWQESYGSRRLSEWEVPTVRRYITMLRPLLYR